MGERLHLSDTEIIKDLRKYRTPLDILSHFVSKTEIAIHGLGFYRPCEYKVAILAISDIFLFSSRIGPLAGLA